MLHYVIFSHIILYYMKCARVSPTRLQEEAQKLEKEHKTLEARDAKEPGLIVVLVANSDNISRSTE